jgi:hypothetical protein
MLALAQISQPCPLSTRGNAPAKELPNAPSASQPAAPVTPVTKEQATTKGATNVQSWWLVSPLNAPYRPLTPREKFQSFVHHSYSPYTFFTIAYDASWAQLWGDPYQYGGGMEGWGKRMGSAAAGEESRSFFGTFLFPVLLHQDPRYFAMYHGPLKNRAFHAVSRVFVTRGDDGRNEFNTSGALTIAFTESLGMAWAPEGQRTASKTFTRMLGAVQGEAVSNLLREFTPDFLRMFKRHAPERLKKIEQRLPPQVTGDTQP